MIDLSRVITDPRIAQKQPFTVWRKSTTWQGGRPTSTELPVSIDGIITPASARDIQQVPEGDRVGGEITILTIQPIYITRAGNEQGTSDEVEWDGDRYRVFNVFPWKDYGFYHGIGIRKTSK